MNHFNGQMESRTDLTLSAIWIDQGIFTYPKVTMYCITQQNSCWLVPVLLLQWSHRAKHGNQFSQKEMMLVHKVTSLFSFQYFMFMSTKLHVLLISSNIDQDFTFITWLTVLILSQSWLEESRTPLKLLTNATNSMLNFSKEKHRHRERGAAW